MTYHPQGSKAKKKFAPGKMVSGCDYQELKIRNQQTEHKKEEPESANR